MESILLAALLILPTTLIAAKPTQSTNSIDYPLYQKVKRNLNYKENLEQRILLHSKTLLKYNIVNDENDNENLLVRGGSSKKKRAAPTTGSSFLAGNDLSYYASISLGTPHKTYEVVLDTGSSDLVIALSASNQCGTSCTPTAPFYSISGSSTSKTNGQPVKLSYGTGSASGTVVSDTMSMSGFTATQAFAACNDISDLTSSSDQNGLLGLGWQSLSASNSTPFLQGLWQTGAFTSPMFGFGLAQLSATAVPNPTSVVPGGIMTVGGINTTLFTGTMNWIPLTSQSYWTIPLDNVGVAGNQLGISSANAVIDTGTNAIAVPASAAQAIYNAIPGSQSISGSGGLYAYPCATQVSFSLTFGGQVYTMRPSDFNTGAANRAGTQCVGAVSSLGSSNSAYQWIIGTPFLFSFYNAYRFSPPAVGLATIADPGKILESLPIPTSGATSVGSDSNVGPVIAAGSGSSGTTLLPSLSTATLTGTSSTVTALAIGQSGSLPTSSSSKIGTTTAAGSATSSSSSSTPKSGTIHSIRINFGLVSGVGLLVIGLLI